MDMHEATDHENEAFDTISLSDLHIYSDPSSSSSWDEHEKGSSFSSFHVKVAGFLPPEEIVIFQNLLSLPENEPSPRQRLQKPSRMKTFPVQDGGGKVVRPRQRRAWRGYLLFGLGGSPASPSRIVPVSHGGVKEVTTRRKSGNWLGKLVGACIPVV
ncbi:hypothetical protein Hanom_Chr07g00669981 [Helianthus anomalus]